jgi:uncharacterized phage infection (PIP) family protein YhgE
MSQPTDEPTANLHRDDISLQGWGARLRKYVTATEESNKINAKATNEAGKLATALERLANQADTEMPAANSLTASMQAAAAEARSIAAEAEALDKRRAKLLGQVEGFKPMFDREHETDNDRLHRPRKSHGVESKADVGRAAQDL